MHGKVERRLQEPFDIAQANGSCLVPFERRDRRALWRAAQDVSEERAIDFKAQGKAPAPYVSPFPGLYLRGEYWLDLKPDELARHIIQGLAALHPHWAFCSYSAALLHGLDVPWELLDDVHIAQERGHMTRNSFKLVRHAVDACHLERVGGVTRTDLCETVLECLCSAPFDLSLGIVDSALRRHRLERTHLEAYFQTAGRGRHGIARARSTLSYADPRAENGGESRARAVMIEEGYAPHDLQVSMRDPFDPLHSIRPDYVWYCPDGSIRLGELDGEDKYLNPLMTGGADILSIVMGERRRESHLSLFGPVMRFPYSYVVDRWKLVQLMQAYGIPHSEIPALP